MSRKQFQNAVQIETAMIDLLARIESFDGYVTVLRTMAAEMKSLRLSSQKLYGTEASCSRKLWTMEESLENAAREVAK